MATFVESIRAALDEIRGIPGQIGTRPYTVSVRVTTWSGARVGIGTPTTTDTRVRVGDGDPHVRPVSDRAVVASGGALEAHDLVLGPFTPGVLPVATLDPATSATPTEVLFLLTGPNLPAAGALYRAIAHDFTSNTAAFVTVRKLGA